MIFCSLPILLAPNILFDQTSNAKVSSKTWFFLKIVLIIVFYGVYSTWNTGRQNKNSSRKTLLDGPLNKMNRIQTINKRFDSIHSRTVQHSVSFIFSFKNQKNFVPRCFNLKLSSTLRPVDYDGKNRFPKFGHLLTLFWPIKFDIIIKNMHFFYLFFFWWVPPYNMGIKRLQILYWIWIHP